MRSEDTLAFDRLDTFADRAEYAIVGPADNRVQETATQRYPFNTICHLGRDFGDGRLQGCSGVLIRPTVVMTAAHCLYNLLLGRGPRRIEVRPGRRNRDAAPFGMQMASRAYVSAGFVGEPGRRLPRPRIYDYGLVALPAPFRRLDRFMPLHVTSDEKLGTIRRSGLITIAGYPGDRPIGTMWRHSEKLRGWTPRRLFYTVATCPGHSGSPIWRQSDGGDPAIIGVHTSGIVDERGRAYGCGRDTVFAPPGAMNSGLRLVPDLIADVRDPVGMVERRRRMLRVL